MSGVDIAIIILINCSSISMVLLLREWTKKIPQSNQEQTNFFIRIHNYLSTIGWLLVSLMIIGLIFNIFQITLDSKYGTFARVVNSASRASPVNKFMLAIPGIIMIMSASRFKNKLKEAIKL